jgi:large subunit ribosomal protein L29
MKIKEIRELSRPELEARKRELREESFHLRIQQQSGQLERPSSLRSIRREVAQVETVLAEKIRSTAQKASQ